MTARPHHRVAGRSWLANAWVNFTGPLRDEHDDRFSLTKILAAYFATLDGASVMLALEHQITATHLWLAIICIAAAFGKSTFNFALRRLSLRTELTQRDTTERVDKTETKRVEEIRRRVESTRDPETGEPLPGAPGQEATP